MGLDGLDQESTDDRSASSKWLLPFAPGRSEGSNVDPMTTFDSLKDEVLL